MKRRPPKPPRVDLPESLRREAKQRREREALRCVWCDAVIRQRPAVAELSDGSPLCAGCTREIPN